MEGLFLAGDAPGARSAQVGWARARGATEGPEWRPIAELTLTSDHRAVDGAGAARFLKDLKAHLERAEE